MRTSRLPMSDSVRIAGEIAEAIEEAHLAGVIHRDLKPKNVMLTTQGHVKVMDFGIAKRALSSTDQTLESSCESLTREDVCVGTPDYMSPEQLTAGSVDQRSDLFSFGIMLWQILTGEHPFRRRSALETMAAILRDPPDLSVSSGSGMLPGWMVLVRRLLAKLPDDRYASMQEVRADMARIAAQSTSPTPASPVRNETLLIGREKEQHELVRKVDAAFSGHGSVVLIGGEPGIGKSHLCRALLAEASRRGCFAVVGHCYELEGAPPYVPFIEMLEYSSRVAPRESFRHCMGDAASEIAKLMPELRLVFPDIPPPADVPPEQMSIVDCVDTDS
jgi:hypothetical protein